MSEDFQPLHMFCRMGADGTPLVFSRLDRCYTNMDEYQIRGMLLLVTVAGRLKVFGIRATTFRCASYSALGEAVHRTAAHTCRTRLRRGLR